MQPAKTAQPSSRHSVPDKRRWRTAFLSCIENLPTPSSQCRKLYFYLQGKHATLEGAAELISRDPLMTVEVMRSAKSAVYGSRGADSLEDALQAIGVERLGRIALRLWLRNLMPSRLPAYCLDGGSFIRRSVACGAAMRYIYQGDSDQTETAYAVGLLHSIGRIIIDEAIRIGGEDDFILQESTARRVAKVELQEFGATHAEIGGLALRRWGFSRLVYEPVSQQFSGSAASSGTGWTQSLAIARFTADRVMEALEGVADPLRGEGRAIYRGKCLSDIFEYTLAIAQEETAIQSN